MRLLVTGGGTGGHLFPGIAVADAVKARFRESKILFVVTGRRIDTTNLSCRGLDFRTIRCEPLKGMNRVERFLGLLKLPLGLWDAARIVRTFRPDMVLGVGGYVTGPMTLAAHILGVKTGIHEQNSVPGMTNRWLGRLVDKIFISIPGSEAYFPAGKAILTGNPIRDELIRAAGAFKAAEEGATVLVLGGSQGAHRVNTLVVETMGKYFARLPDNFRLIHQTGLQDEEWVKEAYGKMGIDVRVGATFIDMAEKYGAADLVLSRAGATTLAELAVMGKPAVLIPYPFAADAHQEKNAQYLVTHGAARMSLERDMTPERLVDTLTTLLKDRKLLKEMARNAASLAKPNAAAAIVDECVAMMGRK